MDVGLESNFAELTDIQREAVDWNEGALLVLAGPGSGKTRVLTSRIARLLDSTRDQRFRILALTFTTKAAHEMATRVDKLVPGSLGRASITTFHGFCAQMLRQHGVHLGIDPDFVIFSLEKDRQNILGDALFRDRQVETHSDDLRFLPAIDWLKSQLVEPKDARRHLEEMKGYIAADSKRVANAYRLYEEELRRLNALDFNSLILEASRLFSFPALARQCQKNLSILVD